LLQVDLILKELFKSKAAYSLAAARVLALMYRSSSTKQDPEWEILLNKLLEFYDFAILSSLSDLSPLEECDAFLHSIGRRRQILNAK
jgi:hypothetical protein